MDALLSDIVARLINVMTHATRVLCYYYNVYLIGLLSVQVVAQCGWLGVYTGAIAEHLLFHKTHMS